MWLKLQIMIWVVDAIFICKKKIKKILHNVGLGTLKLASPQLYRAMWLTLNRQRSSTK